MKTRRVLLREAGFTLAEILIAMAVLTIGIVGAGVALSGGLSAGADYGLAAITRGHYLSTATMLAQARLEEIYNAQYTATVDRITTANFPNEGYGTIPNYPNFRRAVTIQDGVPDAATKTITVQTFFRPPREFGLGLEESVRLVTVMAQRP